MNYKIDEKLPWFEARAILKEDMYVNIISEAFEEELNPNGLFSGFLSGQIFYTSRWNGFEFEPFQIQLEYIDKVLFLESVEKKKPKIKDFRKDCYRSGDLPKSPLEKHMEESNGIFKEAIKEQENKKPESLTDAFKRILEESENNKKNNRFINPNNSSKDSFKNINKDYEELAKIISKSAKIYLDNSGAPQVFKNWEDFFNTPKKDNK